MATLDDPSYEGVPGCSAFVPSTGLGLRGAVGSTLTFRLIGHPGAGDPVFREKYLHHRHDYQDAELRVNGETYPAVEVCDADLGIRVRAAAVKGETVIAVVPVDRDVPGVSVRWPSDAGEAL
ncbi:MAG: hypothetical protein HOY79_28875 [Streptomyces sp.]|nr:hypothetical protein [Streptomyces sp.]